MDAATFIQSQLTDSKSLTDFRQSIRAAIRGLYQADFGLFGFIDSMRSTIERNFRQAWAKGAKECGINENELTLAEINRREEMINTSLAHLVGFGQAIIAGRDDKPLSSFFVRGEKWVNRWFEVIEIAKGMTCQDQKLIWEIGDAEHCRTCLKLNGRVMRASRWEELDVHPRDTRQGKLECNGFNCDCRRRITDAKATPGPLPSLP